MVSTFRKYKHLDNIAGIYVITNVVNGNRYIGSSKNIRGRLHVHSQDLINNRHSSKKLQEDWNTYGKESFSFNLIEECGLDVLVKREQHFIDTTNPEYNVCRVAGYSVEPFRTEEARLKLSKNRARYWKGKTRPQATKDKISLAKKGKSNGLFGENHPNSKLTHSQVQEIREYYSSQQFNQAELSKLYKVNQSIISDIVNKKTWKSAGDI